MADTFQMPAELAGKSAEDIAQLYLDTRKQYDEYKGQWEPRAKDWESYSSFGKPDQIKQIFDWGRGVAAPVLSRIEKGEAYLLNDADYKAYKAWADKTGNGTKPAEVTPSPDDDLFAPVEKRLEEKLLNAIGKMIGEREQKFRADITGWQKLNDDKFNLFNRAQQLKGQYPNLNFEEIIKKLSDVAQMPADKLLEWGLEQEGKLAGLEGEIEKRVAAKLAEKEAEKGNDSVKTLLESRRVGGSYPTQRPTREAAVRGLVETLNGKYPGVFERIPLA